MKTEIIAVIDASGSMEGLTGDTIGGFNRFLTDQRAAPGEAKVTVVLFNEKHHALYAGVDLKTAAPLSRETYKAGGGTALLDALGATIDGEGRRIKDQAWADSVIVCVITDGEENSSREYSREKVKEMVKHADGHKWTFTFLGANIDAFAAATSIGIQGANSMGYAATQGGTQAAYATFAANTTSLRGGLVTNLAASASAIGADLLDKQRNANATAKTP